MIDWSPGIGDPDPISWFIVFFYIVTSFLTFTAGMFRAQRDDRQLKARWFWFIATFILLLLAVNKQLDIQTLFAEVGRFLANHYGFYEKRRVVQTVFVLLVVCTSLTFLIFLSILLKGAHHTVKLAHFGLIVIVAFIIIRASSFHQVDAYLGLEFLNVRVNWLIEIAGIFIVAISAATYTFQAKR